MTTLQVNIGKLCNLACTHCHVGSGPNKIRENMAASTCDQIIRLLEKSPTITTVDITGGAPEMNPYFRRLVTAARAMGKQVWDRCNLTVLFEPGQETTIDFFVEQEVHLVASLPCYTAKNVEKQRGDGVFAKSIEALQMLNRAGYAQSGTGLAIDLVYNPAGAQLPPDQQELEAAYHEKLKKDFGISFNRLYTITNMPIKRFLVDLRRSGQEEAYMTMLANAFNPQAAENVMCRDLVSISWDGRIYDCDFNQALGIPLPHSAKSVFDLTSFEELACTKIATADHCYGCTAGAGSSCTGAVSG